MVFMPVSIAAEVNRQRKHFLGKDFKRVVLV